MEVEVTKRDQVVWGLGECGGVDGWVDTETVGVFLWERLPGLFGLRRFPYPDVGVARVQLAAAKRDRPGEPARVRQDVDELPEGRQRSAEPRWRLNQAGIDWYRASGSRVAEAVRRAALAGARRAPRTGQVRDDRILGALVARVRGRPSFRAFRASPGRRWGERDLTIQDFFAVLLVDPHTPEPSYQRARAQAVGLLGESVEAKYVEKLANLYGSRYRRYYDEAAKEGA